MSRALSLVARVIWHPTGFAGRHRPLFHRNLTDRLRGVDLRSAVGDRVVLVTGASSGIGRATALRLARAGAHVLLVSRSVHALEDVRDAIGSAGGRASVHPADLADPQEVERLVAEVLEAHGHVDVLVNNAGRSIRRSVEASRDRPHDVERVLQLNYLGAVRLITALLPSMRTRRRGLIVNISTAGVQLRPPRFAGYIASKAALEAFSDVVAGEVYDDRVRFTTVLMPLVRTPMIAPTPAFRGTPSISAEQAADMVCRAIVYHPPRVGTVLGDLAELGARLWPRAALARRAAEYRATRESPAASAPPPSRLGDSA